MAISDDSPGHDTGALQSKVNFLADNQRNVLDVAGKLDMSLFPLIEEFHFRDFGQNTIGQAPYQDQSADAHVLSEVVPDGGFVDLHEQPEDVGKDY